jgi:UDP-glucose 4-epimerase
LAEVASYTRILPGQLDSFNAGVVFIEGDIRNADLMIQCTKDMDCIVHLAANTGVGPSVDNPRLDMECNVIGTFNMLEAARINNVKKFVFASSGAPVGEIEPPIHEEVPPHPVSPYGASKLAGEGYCSAYYRTFKIDTICLRFGNVYGPRSKHKSSVIAKFIKNALSNEICTVFGDGSQTRDFIYIDDLIRAIYLSVLKNVGGEVFQIATGSESTVGEVAVMIAQVLESFGKTMVVQNDVPRLGDVQRNYSDTRKAKKMLNWDAEVSLHDGIKKTVVYFLDQNE